MSLRRTAGVVKASQKVNFFPRYADENMRILQWRSQGITFEISWCPLLTPRSRG